MVYILQQGAVYGPVHSRRYGLSLGINLSPCKYKLCSFDCIYCHYGYTHERSADVSAFQADLPTVAEVVGQLESALRICDHLDLITFSGNGEPTLHPGFPELVDEVVALRDRLKPGARVALLSNSTGLRDAAVRGAVAKIDLPVFKLDAGTEATFQAINRPAAGITFPEIVSALTEMVDICIQTVLFDGELSNVGEDELTAYFDLLVAIQPREVHLYTTDRPVADCRIRRVHPDRMRTIAAEAQRYTGVAVKAYVVS